jgi:hypothetical protein
LKDLVACPPRQTASNRPAAGAGESLSFAGPGYHEQDHRRSLPWWPSCVERSIQPSIQPVSIPHHIAALEFVVAAIRLHAHRSEAEKGPVLANLSGIPADGVSESVRKPRIGLAPGTRSSTVASITITSSGEPIASRASPVEARLRAVRLPLVVAIATRLPSHQEETAMRCGRPASSAVASHTSWLLSIARRTSAFR